MKKREYNLIIGIVIIALFTTYTIVNKNIKIKNIEKQNDILLDAVSDGIKGASNTMNLISEMSNKSQMTQENVDYFVDSVLIYSDSMIYKINEFE